MWDKIKAWYMKTFLPFEDPESPNYCAPYEEPDLSDWDDLGPYKSTEGIGPKYKEYFYKPKTYKKWGSKWYKSDT